MKNHPCDKPLSPEELIFLNESLAHMKRMPFEDIPRFLDGLLLTFGDRRELDGLRDYGIRHRLLDAELQLFAHRLEAQVRTGHPYWFR